MARPGRPTIEFIGLSIVFCIPCIPFIPGIAGEILGKFGMLVFMLILGPDMLVGILEVVIKPPNVIGC